jgi:hypothetical protein
MAIAAWRIWLTGGGFNGAARTPLIWFFIQLAFNFGWSFFFFTAQSPLLGLDRDRAVLAVDRGHHGAVLAARPVGGADVRALHLLGELCRGAEFCNLAYELTPWLLDSATDSDLEQNRNTINPFEPECLP